MDILPAGAGACADRGIDLNPSAGLPLWADVVGWTRPQNLLSTRSSWGTEHRLR
ncbi:hypothetical protein CALVIDRAFT_540561 [Calocera viscosa TUFC12733]|uniref:Uncharacterized protein n=1 Tax=Calocera viscosa (strain TUFC12733) TaxID=1330018 RepID=A0A167IRD4_CALVF|nr:hypothetical protein CALVIDRAFT_540561 [Calocera viscosa TUFC12733]